MSKILLADFVWESPAPENAIWIAAMARRPDVMPTTIKGRPTDYARNQAIRAFLQNPAFTHIMSIDADTAPPFDAIDRLLALDVPIASGIYNVIGNSGLEWASAWRDADGHYHLYKDIAMDRPYYCDAAGAGCLLIRRDVFEKLSWPWFKWVEHEDGSQMSEDIFFFQKANAAGLQVLCDPAVYCDHYKTVNLKSLRKV